MIRRFVLSLLLVLGLAVGVHAASTASANISLKSNEKVLVEIATTNSANQDVDPQYIDWTTDNASCAYAGGALDSRRWYITSADGIAAPCTAHLIGVVRAANNPTIELNVSVTPDQTVTGVSVSIHSPEPK